LALAIGIIGIAVPLLPTTPLLLLAAACYLRGSERMQDWMLSNRLFGRYLRNYVEGNEIPTRVKAGTVTLLWAVIALSAVFMTTNTVIRIILIVIAVGVTTHLLTMRPRGHTSPLPRQASGQLESQLQT